MTYSIMVWIVFPPSSYIEVLTPRTSEWAVFGGQVFKEVIKLKQGLLGLA